MVTVTLEALTFHLDRLLLLTEQQKKNNPNWDISKKLTARILLGFYQRTQNPREAVRKTIWALRPESVRGYSNGCKLIWPTNDVEELQKLYILMGLFDTELRTALEASINTELQPA